MDHISCEKSWFPHCRDDDICRDRIVSEIFRAAITARDGGSRINEHESHRFSDNIRPTDHDYFFPGNIDVIVLQEGHNPFRGTAPESVMPEEHIADLGLREAVDVFSRVDALRHGIPIDMIGQGSLHDNPMDILIG